MKQLWCVIVIAVAIGCGGDPLKADVDTFCNAAEATGGRSFIELGPYIAEHMKTDELKPLFAGIRTGTTTLEMIAAKLRDMMRRAGVDRCPTLDLLMAKRSGG